MLDRSYTEPGALIAERVAPLPVAGMITGMELDEAATLLPRLFNLCRVAQGLAARLSFGLPVAPSQAEALRQEVLREHLIKFCLKYPGHFGLGAQPLPDGWQSGSAVTRQVLFGPAGRLPSSPEAFEAFLETGEGVAQVLRRISACFAPGEACSDRLPSVTPEIALSASALENSVAARHETHPVLRDIETRCGRGPLWRATARAYDAQDCLDGRLPDCVTPAPGVAVVPAARGTYAIAATVEACRLTSFRRITPTDHLLAQGGILDQTLATLPPHKAGLAPLILDILDPCSPVKLKEVSHA